ncbi:hypothetical protein QZH41_004393 [Actinostola sp. cb2023]|nr:hypothetical protein QZH41_004393 [Actinostola sp. cb2023]
MAYDINNVSVPRLAHLLKGDKGYGFNLHGDKNQPGQTISAVDKDSPAELGGLREGDKVIEVNGQNVENKTHGDVVGLIKLSPSETTLLVCDKETLAYLKENNRECTIDMANLATVVPKKEEEPAPVIANGDATPEVAEVVHEKVVESEPAAIEESTPPPVIVTKDHEDAPAHDDAPPADTIDTTAADEPADTTPEEVKELNSVLDEQEKPSEQPESSPPPAVAEPAEIEPPKAEDPAKPADNSGLVFDMKSARPSGNKRRQAKTSGEGWANKVNAINSM